MGIKPIEGQAVSIPQDTAGSRWGDWITDMGDSGSVAGDVFAETHALALASNSWIEEDGYGLASGIEGSLDEARRAVELAEENKLEIMQARDDAQDQAIKLLAEVQELQMATSSHMLMTSGTTVVENDYFRFEPSGDYWRLVKKGSWAGVAMVHGRTFQNHWIGENRANIWAADVTMIDVMTASSWTLDQRSGNPIVVYFNVQPGEARNQEYTLYGGVVNAGEWTTLQNVTTDAEGAVRMTGLLRVTWQNADRGLTYGVRILVNGAVMGSYTSSGLGPLTPLGSGVVSMSKTWEFTVPAGATLQFQAYCSGGTAAQRTMQGGLGRLVWSE